MKKVTSLFLALLIAGMSIFMVSCYGSFALTKKLYTWNGTVGDKFAKEAVFLVLNIIPVYGVCAFVDVIYLNSVEFWTGKNPVALNNGDNRLKIDGQDVKICMQSNSAILYNKLNHEIARLNFKEDENTWYATFKGETVKLMSIENNQIKLYTPTGKVINVNKSDLDSKATLLKFTQLLAVK